MPADVADSSATLHVDDATVQQPARIGTSRDARRRWAGDDDCWTSVGCGRTHSNRRCKTAMGFWVWTMVVIFGGIYYSEDEWPLTGDSFDGTGGTPDYSRPRIRPSGARALCHLLGLYPPHASSYPGGKYGDGYADASCATVALWVGWVVMLSVPVCCCRFYGLGRDSP